jgi:hypothetical protein
MSKFAALMLTCALLLGACTGGSNDPSACGPTVRESLDPQSALHVLDAGDVSYLTNPPTSGPHAVAAAIGGVQTEPLPAPIQVGILESGRVLIQYRDTIDQLDQLATDTVIVAPNASLGAPIVITAWLHKMECTTVNIEELERFIGTNRNRGPAH